jgi:bloom syndrome protein
MQNQEAGLREKRVDVVSWNSETDYDDGRDIVRRLRGADKPKLMYVSPEKLQESNSLRSILSDIYRERQLARFVIDEAHCISTWGQDFREAYQGLGRLRDEYPNVPIIALTATANQNTVDDIMQRLRLRNPAKFTQSFNRTNLSYYIYPKKKSVVEEIAKFIKDKHRNKTGVIYCLGRDKCEKVAKALRDKGLNAKHFHAGMDPRDKNTIQEEWQAGRVHIIVATVRFHCPTSWHKLISM